MLMMKGGPGYGGDVESDGRSGGPETAPDRAR
jgi:hypothetical protein